MLFCFYFRLGCIYCPWLSFYLFLSATFLLCAELLPLPCSPLLYFAKLTSINPRPKPVSLFFFPRPFLRSLMFFPGGDWLSPATPVEPRNLFSSYRGPVRVIHLIGPQLQDTSSSYSSDLYVRVTGLVPGIPITGQRLSASHSSRAHSGSFMVSHVTVKFLTLRGLRSLVYLTTDAGLHSQLAQECQSELRRPVIAS